MVSRIALFFCRSARSGHTGSGGEHHALPELERELEDLRKLSLNSLMMFLGIHLIAGSNALGPLTYTLLLYTITLHLTVSTSFLQNCPTLSRFLHAFPLFGIFCMAVAEFIMDVRSPALVAGGLLVGASPLLVIVIYHARAHAEMASMCLPVRLREVQSLEQPLQGQQLCQTKDAESGHYK